MARTATRRDLITYILRRDLRLLIDLKGFLYEAESKRQLQRVSRCLEMANKRVEEGWLRSVKSASRTGTKREMQVSYTSQ